MRRCQVCDSLTPQDSAVCNNCLYFDVAWAANLESVQRSRKDTQDLVLPDWRQLSLLKPAKSAKPLQFLIRLSAFSDSGELGFYLCKIEGFLESNTGHDIHIILDGSSWGYDWDYGYDFDPERDYYLPPSLPIAALVEISRFINVLVKRYPQLTIRLKLPPKQHAATQFIQETQLFSCIPWSNIGYANQPIEQTYREGCNHVLVPLSAVGPETGGQLSQSFHDSFNKLADAGQINRSFRSSIRLLIMEAAENADIWGRRGWLACFLRQEKRGKVRFHSDASFLPERETHLFLHVYTIGRTLAESLRMSNEWDAAIAVSKGYSARGSGGGRGMPSILRTITESALGTAFICSGNYTRIITPDQFVREYHSAGADYLPGVHICAVIPLTVISQPQSLPLAVV
jgi:hypothetical protein